MKKLILILSLCISSFVWADESSRSSAAIAWLNIIDSGNYAESWDKSAPFFKSQVTQAQWEKAIEGVRTPLGKVNSRVELSVKPLTSLPGMPDGEYLIIQFQTDFQNKASSTETVTLSHSKGQWLAVGYFIK